MQANAAFTANGPVSIFATFDQMVASGTVGGLTNANDIAVFGINSAQFSDDPLCFALGDFQFAQTASGDAVSYALHLSPTTSAAFVSAINAGNPFSLIISTNESASVATFAGVGNSSFAGPSLSLSTVPEPRTVALLALAGIGVVLLHVRRTRFA